VDGISIKLHHTTNFWVPKQQPTINNILLKNSFLLAIHAKIKFSNLEKAVCLNGGKKFLSLYVNV
jgi:hypothetical protein